MKLFWKYQKKLVLKIRQLYWNQFKQSNKIIFVIHCTNRMCDVLYIFYPNHWTYKMFCSEYISTIQLAWIQKKNPLKKHTKIHSNKIHLVYQELHFVAMTRNLFINFVIPAVHIPLAQTGSCFDFGYDNQWHFQFDIEKKTELNFKW